MSYKKSNKFVYLALFLSTLFSQNYSLYFSGENSHAKINEPPAINENQSLTYKFDIKNNLDY